MNHHREEEGPSVAVRRDQIEELRDAVAALYATAQAARADYEDSTNHDLATGDAASHDALMFFALLRHANCVRAALAPVARLL